MDPIVLQKQLPKKSLQNQDARISERLQIHPNRIQLWLKAQSFFFAGLLPPQGKTEIMQLTILLESKQSKKTNWKMF